MPLIKSPSDEALQKNIETEIHAGKPPKVACAIAYSVQRNAKKKKRKLKEIFDLTTGKVTEENSLSNLEENAFLKDDAGKKWIKDNLHITRYKPGRIAHVKTREDGYFDIFGSVILMTDEIEVKLGNIEGTFSVASYAAESIKTLDKFPQKTSGKLDLGFTSIKSFKGLPECRWIDAISCKNLKDIKDIFPFIKHDLFHLNLSDPHSNITDLRGIADLVKVKIGTLAINVRSEDFIGGLGVLLIPELKSLTMIGEYPTIAEPWGIISKYLGKPEQIFECQNELIEAGYENMAQL